MGRLCFLDILYIISMHVYIVCKIVLGPTVQRSLKCETLTRNRRFALKTDKSRVERVYKILQPSSLQFIIHIMFVTD